MAPTFCKGWTGDALAMVVKTEIVIRRTIGDHPTQHKRPAAIATNYSAIEETDCPYGLNDGIMCAGILVLGTLQRNAKLVTATAFCQPLIMREPASEVNDQQQSQYNAASLSSMAETCL